MFSHGGHVVPSKGGVIVRSRYLEMDDMSIAETTRSGIQLREVVPVDVKVRNVSVTVRPSRSAANVFKNILATSSAPNDSEHSEPSVALLKDVSADMPRGSLTAIIGASGSGKTTLLNVLAGRLDNKSLKISGTKTFNGSPRSNGGDAYVMQQDSLIPSLTVRETLQYAAELRLRDVTNTEERNAIVEQTILELSLKECASTRIGSSSAKGCSGGEKRRTSIGVQLLQNPSVLFCDEVTTGLDSTSAYQVVQTLKDFAQKGRTVIMTIHQPRSEIWELFDRVVVLSQGSCVYNGETKNCLPYFETLGFKAPPFVNPAEFIINLVAIDKRSSRTEKPDLERFYQMKSSWAESQVELSNAESRNDLSNNSLASKHKTKVSPFRQFTVMTRRSIVVSFRDPKGLIGTVVESIVVGFILGWAFYQLDDSLQGIRSRQGAFYAAAAVQCYLTLVYEVHRCCEELPIFDREHNEGVVDVIPFLLSRRAAKSVEDLLMAFLYSTIFYFMVGLRPGADHFFVFLATVLLGQLTAVSVALFGVSIFRDFANAAMIGFALFGASNFAGGCFLPANKIPVYVGWVKWISYIFYAYGALNNNEFLERTFPCQKIPGGLDANCIQFSGAFQLQVSGISLSIWQQLLALLGLIGAFNIAAGLILFFSPVKIKMSKKPQAAIERPPFGDSQTRFSPQTRQGAFITLANFSLDIQNLRPWGSVHSQYSILKPLSTAFKPGVLNIIMGPSGSGKTTLLSSLAGRLQNSLTMRYEVRGELYINGSSVKNSQLGSMVSLVTQEDEGLLPCLTVRETLRFAAALRLTGLPVKERYRRAEEILLRMGLNDCADTLVGNDLIKGLSGGEKRRTTIAIQLLTSPDILLLDEPTSGLDHFTAQSIVQLLTELAAEGRTVILTIHQNRSDLSETNVLLLARGGHVAYSGPGNNMLTHFREAGYECSTRTDPADFVLDLITIDLRHGEREAETRRRAETLIAIWSAKVANDQNTKEASHEVYSLPENNKSFIKSAAPFTTAFPILLHRSALNLWRERNAMIARITNVGVYGILIALFYAPLHTDYQGVLTRLGLIQLYCFLYFTGTLNNIAHFPLEKPVMDQEIEERAYNITPFFLSFTLLELPFTIFTSLFTATIIAFPLGIRSAEIFFAMTLDTFVLVSCGESLAMALNALIPDSALTLSITNMLICIAQIMAGILSVDMPRFLKAVTLISPLPYVSRNLMPYFFRGVVFDCAPGGGGECVGTRGEDVLKLYGFDRNTRVQLGILVGIMFGYRFFAFGVFYLKKRSWR